MNIDHITADVVGDALHALRYAHSLAGSPLLDLDAITLRLRADGLADTRQGRAWLLEHLLHELVETALQARRGPAAPGGPPSAADDDAWLVADYRRGDAELEAWCTLYARYLSTSGRPFGEVAELVGVPGRTVRRRLSRGVEALAEALRAAEVAAGRELAAPGDAAAYHRILVEPGAERRGVLTLLGELLAALRSEAGVLRVSGDQLQAMAAYPASELLAWRLGRIAEWSQPRYRLDERFVALSLLVDLGEESASGRWQVQERRFTDLRDVLAEVPEPAVVLLGPPGSGKSTLLRRLELELATRGLGQLGDEGGTAGAPLTLLVSLNQYRPATPGDPPPAPGAWLAERWARRYPKLPPLPELMDRGGLVLLLDGLNEIPHSGADGYRERIGLWKHYLHETLVPGSGHRAVIACRSLDYSAPLSTPRLRVPQVRLEPLTDERAQAFLARYSPADAEALWAEMAGTPLLDAVRWPFFLRLLVEEAALTGVAPRDLAALFTGLVRRALVREVERDNPRFAPGPLLSAHDYERLVSQRGWRTPWELPEGGALVPALAELAHGIQVAAVAGESSQARIGYEAALALLPAEQPAEQPAEIVRAGAALGVVEVDQAANEVLFSHQLVQEYFAGRRLAREPEPERVAAAWRVADIRPGLREILDSLPPAETLPALPQTGWEETTLLAASMLEHPEPFVRGLMPHNLALAGRAANLPAVRPKLGATFLDELRWALVTRSREPAADLRHRIDCGYAVGDLGDPRWERRVGPHGEYLLPPMVAIAGGVYPIGDDEPYEWVVTGASGITSAHIPRHDVELAPFEVGQFAVTNAEWGCFVAAGGYEDEQWWDTMDSRQWQRGELANEVGKANNRLWRRRFAADPALLEQWVEEGRFQSEKSIERWRKWMKLDDAAFERALEERFQARRIMEPQFWRYERFNQASQPVIGVCWYEARAYCAWLSAQTGLTARLPTEVEWEAAAHGGHGRLHPWGAEFDRARANTYETQLKRTTPVGVFPEGDAEAGAADMSGNVYEWTSSLFGEGEEDVDVPTFAYPYDARDCREDIAAPPSVRRVLRGGGWDSRACFARVAYRDGARPGGRSVSLGLRLVCQHRPPS